MCVALDTHQGKKHRGPGKVVHLPTGPWHNRVGVAHHIHTCPHKHKQK